MKKKLIIEGMSCQNCVRHVTEALEEMPGVKNVDVDLDNKSAEVELEYDIEDEEFRFVLDDIGYELVEVEDL
ncbi:MAG TPA: heavy-metal-associated domain-containing protein [Clostridiaceae bacterium]|nr:heavy-metal-associated domain-containing protein [Clostridiaceae bacterium]